MAKIYLASSWRNEEYPFTLARLREHGHEVYDFRNPKPGDNGFKWEGIDPNWKNWNAVGYRNALKHPLAERGFKLDFDAMRWADFGVLLLPSGRSAHLEAGWMAGAGKQVAVLTRDGEEPELMAKLLGGIMVSHNELLGTLARWELELIAATDKRLLAMEAAPASSNGAAKLKPMDTPTVPAMLRECADVYEQRNAIYGDNYKWFGKVMAAMFSDGLTIQTPDDWNRIGLFVQKIAKATRYAKQFTNGGHDDSLVDDSVYSQMLREVDHEISALVHEEF